MATSGAECGIQVCCRIRPLNSSEKTNGSQFIAKFPSEESINVAGKNYIYDRVFGPNCDQEIVYMGSAHHIVQDVLNGYNGTVFAYGQTSSGKTHTMEGVIGNPEKEGIIPRIINDIFKHIYNFEEENVEFHIKISYFEIYNEKIRDLLDVTKTNLPIHEDKNRVPYVKGITEQFVSSSNEVLSYIEEGKNNRQVAVTNMNEHSSRSHSVFLIQVEQENKDTQKKLIGKLYLVDLAGSEKVSKTGAEGSVLEEAKNINKSLSALGNVISALAEGTKSHVPYRDSKLTRILQESLGGNSRTTIIICCSPASYNEGETKSTLLFGQRAKTIKNVVIVNEELTAEECKRRYERERDKVSHLRQRFQVLESELRRWRGGDRVPESEWTNFIDSAIAPSMSDSTFTLDRSIISQVLLSSKVGPISDDERRKYEEEQAKLCQQLDEKDDEIQVQSQLAEQYKQQFMEQESIIKQGKANYASLMIEFQRKQELYSKSKEEVEELQEVALNLEEKQIECSQLMKENEQLQEEMSEKNLEILKLKSQVDEMNQFCQSQKRRIIQNIHNMFRDMSDNSNNCELDEWLEIVDNEKWNEEELFARARIYISKLNSDYKSARQLLAIEKGSSDAENKIDEVASLLAECCPPQQLIESIHNLRMAFLQELEKRIKKAPTGLECEDEFFSPIQRQKIIFLKNNLEQLTNVHKQLIRDHADLRSELPKMETRYRAATERIKNLEMALRDVKECALHDRKVYQKEIERFEEYVHQRNLQRRGLQIAKPIRPKQHYPSMPCTPGRSNADASPQHEEGT